MEIRYLADRPDAIAALVVAFAEEWPDYAAETGHEAITARFRECLRKDALPLALVGYEGGRLVGTVALRHDSVRSRPALGPWLAALYVAPDVRGQGRGAALVRAAERTAGEIGLAELHTGTSTSRSLFQRLGWRPIEDLEYDGEALTIFHKVIPQGLPREWSTRAMSRFGNPASTALEDAQAYSAALLDLLGDRDALTVLREMPEALRAALEGMSAVELAEPESPGKWSVAEVLDHLSDSELVGSFRFRMVLTQDRPALPGYDQDAWVRRLHPPADDAREAAELALRRFTVLREANVELFGRASAADRKRVGLHAERGEESLEHMMKLYAGHDLVHRSQLARIRAAVSSR